MSEGTVDSNTVDHSLLQEAGLSYRGKWHVKGNARRTLAFLNTSGPLLVEWGILNGLQHFGYDLSVERDNKSQYSVEGLTASLARYGENRDLDSAYLSVLDEAMNRTLRAFGSKTPKFTALPLDEGLLRYTHGEKSSGLPCLGKKRDSFLSDLGRAERIAVGERAPEPCVAFHRVQHGAEGPKTRLVWGYPQSMFLLEAQFAPQLIEHFLGAFTPMAFGLFKSQVSARMQSIRNSGVRYSLDFSGFDSSLHPKLIDFAFRVLRSHFELNEEEAQTWTKVVNYFIHTPIMMPDQSVWVKHRGVPSGSYFTQMVDSIINYLAVTYSWLRATGFGVSDDHVLVLGDDSIVGHVTYFPVEKMASFFNELGLRLNFQKTGITTTGEDPHFLGHVWRRGYPDREEREIAIRMAFPEKPSGIKDQRTRQAIRMLGYMSDAVSSHRVLMKLAPDSGPWVNRSYMSYLTATHGIQEVPGSLRPNWSAFLEELGTADPISSGSLALLGPWVGLYF